MGAINAMCIVQKLLPGEVLLFQPLISGLSLASLASLGFAEPAGLSLDSAGSATPKESRGERWPRKAHDVHSGERLDWWKRRNLAKLL